MNQVTTTDTYPTARTAFNSYLDNWQIRYPTHADVVMPEVSNILVLLQGGYV